MARIADSALEEIRARVDIAELVREYVPGLKRAGRHHKARCPFHQEKTPSFMIHPERQIFHCFGCQTGGDVFAFLMKIEGLSFIEAVEKLAVRAGVRVAPAIEQLGPKEREFFRLREALAFAAEFYARVLRESRGADAARRYLDSRKLDMATRERFGVGYAPPDGASFLEAALRKGFAHDLLAKAGLVSVLEGKGICRDFFRGRVLFPIRNPRGEIAGFGGRALGDGSPKYINSPDTPVFSKGRVLYGLHEGLAELRKARSAILLEGYMDVLAMHQFGLKNSCAPLGTALTPEHCDLLKRYAEEALLVFDPDDAGASASLRGAELLLERGFAVRIATVPGGLDPDELLHKSGVQGLAACLEAARDLPDFQTETALAKMKGPLGAQDLDRIARAILATIAKADSDILKAEWTRRLAERLKMDETALRSQLGRAAGRTPYPPPRWVGVPSGRAGREELSVREAAILRAILRAPELSRDDGNLSEEDFSHDGARRIFRRLREMSSGRAPAAAWSAELLGSLEPADAAIAGALLVEGPADEDPRSELSRLVEEGRLVRRYRELETLVSRMQEGVEPAVPALTQEFQRLLRRLSELRLLDRIK